MYLFRFLNGVKRALRTQHDLPANYFQKFEDNSAPRYRKLTRREQFLWVNTCIIAILLGLRYIWWRWTETLNADSISLSILTASLESIIFLFTTLSFIDIWKERDTPPRFSDNSRSTNLDRKTKISILITCFDEDKSVIEATVMAAKGVTCPENSEIEIIILDDGNRKTISQLAKSTNVKFLGRHDNVGFKAGNLKNGILSLDADLFVICDADTRLFENFLMETVGYFKDSQVSWVQVPHWFYDIYTASEPHDLSKNYSMLQKFLRKADPFRCNDPYFFDIVQRRRNRASASFCCGAASIHRNTTVLSTAIDQLQEKRKFGNNTIHESIRRLEPFRFHISEDFLTSSNQHLSHKPLKSVYHPTILAKMLSPWTIRAWTMQRQKYAVGIFDILLNHFGIFICFRFQKLVFYLSTFSSYVSSLLIGILTIFCLLSIYFEQKLMSATSLEFAYFFIPFILLNEIALCLTTKGYNHMSGRLQNLFLIENTFRVFAFAIFQKKILFKPTPKIPSTSLFPAEVLYSIAKICLLTGFIIWINTTRGFDHEYILNYLWIIFSIAPNILLISQHRISLINILLWK